MAKKGKTRKQKILTDLRRQKAQPQSQTNHIAAPVSEVQLELKAPKAVSVPVLKEEKKNISTVDYSYLRRDLFKTTSLTGFVVIVELAIKFLVKGL